MTLTKRFIYHLALMSSTPEMPRLDVSTSTLPVYMKVIMASPEFEFCSSAVLKFPIRSLLFGLLFASVLQINIPFFRWSSLVVILLLYTPSYIPP